MTACHDNDRLERNTPKCHPHIHVFAIAYTRTRAEQRRLACPSPHAGDVTLGCDDRDRGEVSTPTVRSD